MGLVTPSAGGSETRPACHDAGLLGASCPGRGSVVRDHEARDRTEPRPQGFGESRGGAPKGERALAQGARRASTSDRRQSPWRSAVPVGCASRRSAPFAGGLFCSGLRKARGAKKSAARERDCFFFTLPWSGRVAARSGAGWGDTAAGIAAVLSPPPDRLRSIERRRSTSPLQGEVKEGLLWIAAPAPVFRSAKSYRAALSGVD